MRVVSIALVGCLVFHNPLALLLPVPFTETRRQELFNYKDQYYTGTITIGGQPIKTLFDTGSFELIVLSQDCHHCGSNISRLFNSNQSSTYAGGNANSMCTYGSGTAYTVSAYDDVFVQAFRGSHQFFWKVYDVDSSLSRLLDQDIFDAILGLGPSKSAETFARSELDSVVRQAEEYKMLFGATASDLQQTIRTLEQRLKLAVTSQSLLDTLSILDVSFCFGRTSGSPGYITWNDIAANVYPELFLEMPVVGDMYWSAELTNVKIGALPNSWANQHMLGCNKERCSAVLDTGTTLIMAPSEVAYGVDRIVRQWGIQGGDCEDLSLLPNLELNLGGHAITLPPEAYVARYTGTGASLEQVRHLLPHLYEIYFANNQNETVKKAFSYCASTLSPMDAASQFGPLWILGVSFFRQYYTSFHLSPENATLKGSRVSISSPGADCRPYQRPGSTSLGFVRNLNVGVRKAQLELDVSEIRSSALADKVHRMATTRFPALTQFPFAKVPIVRI